MARQRRVKGEGSVYQRHDHPTCPPLVEGERATHSCRGTWVAQIDLGWRTLGIDADGKPIRRRLRPTLTAPTRKALSEKLVAKRREIESGVITGDSTVEQWLRKWLDEVAPQRVRERTLVGYRGYTERWLIPTLGHYRLSKLSADHVRMLHQAMAAAGLTDATRRQAHMILRRALVVAEREGKIMRNPAALVDPPPVGKGRHDYHTADEARTVLRAVAGTRDLRLISRIMVAYLMGLRQGEALGLQWRDVDLDVGVAYIHEAVTRIKGKGLVTGRPKTDASVRFVPLAPLVVETLRAYRDETAGVGYVFGGDHPVDPRADWQAWKGALQLAGVKDVPLHGARASCASLLRDEGVSERVIADLLGHAQVATTQAHYIRSHDEQRRAALVLASRRLLEPAPGDPPR